MMPDDPFGRTPISDAMKSRVSDALRSIPDGKRGALIVIADQYGTRAQLAACIGHGWKVAAGGGYEFSEKKPYGYIAVAGAW